jgi:cytosine/adenosine deaminase-related metal-dependent hydrolase
VKLVFGPWLYDGEDFVEGGLAVEGGKVVEVFTPRPGEIRERRMVFPLLANAHTHLGDAFIRRVPKGSVEEVVAPPNGFKFKMLAKATPFQISQGIARAAAEMASGGTCAFADFREGGVAGVEAMRRALKGSPVRPAIFGRPSGLEFDRAEVLRLLDAADGIGLSSISEWKRADLLEMSAMAKKSRKAFAIHASERAREPFGRVAELEPAFVVHMVRASVGDMRACADAGTPVVVCPRSNAFFGMKPPVGKLLDAGVEVALGTDNAMLARPDMMAEARFLAKSQTGLPAAELVRMAVANPRKVLNLEPGLRMTAGGAAEFATLACGPGDPAKSFVSSRRPLKVLRAKPG